MLIVVVGLLADRWECKYLCQTNPRSGLWEFPGGKVEEGETMRDALVREWKEEVNLKISVGDLITETVIEFPEHGHVLLPLFKVHLRESFEKRPQEGQTMAWHNLDRIQSLIDNDWCQPTMEKYLPTLRVMV